uniref:Retrotransposon Orf1 n=1 Tax=Tanacetum cinerariifolium TaxID=118510 RepID=A0A6L2LWQ7_TANCI|nr:retrotransposon Orf1 [Tanacetum cinerariifolium]
MDDLNISMEEYIEIEAEKARRRGQKFNWETVTYDKPFSKENVKFNEYVQPLLNKKNEHEKKNKEVLKQINDLDNRLLKAGQIDLTLPMLLRKEDNVNTGKQGLGFENQNDYVNPSLLNKAKELAPCLYNIDEMGKDELSDHKVISEEELKCEAEKRLKAMLKFEKQAFSKIELNRDKPKVVRKNFGPQLIEDWISDSEDEAESKPKIKKKTVKPSFAKIEFVKSKEQVKSPKKTTVKHVEKPRQNTHRPRGDQRNWNNMMSQRLESNFKMYNKACYVCGSFNHLQNDCHYQQRQFQNQKMVKLVWNYNQRVNNKILAKKTHSNAKRNMVPKAVLLKSGIVNAARQNSSKTVVLVNTARQISTAHPKSTVNVARPMSHISKTAHLTVKRPIHEKTTFTNSNVPQKVNTVRSKTVNTARPKAVINVVLGNRVYAVKASACWVWKRKTKLIDLVSQHNSASITLKKFDYIDA